MAIAFDQNESVCLVRLGGEIGIGSAAELKKALVEALASGKAMRVDMEEVTELGVNGFQLLWAAAREAKASGKDFSLSGKVPEEILHACREAGLEKFPVG